MNPYRNPTQDIKRLQRENLPADALPHAHLSLTLYCYLRQEGPTPAAAGSSQPGANNVTGLSSQLSSQRDNAPLSTWRSSLEKAVRSFASRRHLRPQQGTSNVASPAHFRHSNTPRATATSRLGTGAHQPISLAESRLSAVPEQHTPTR